MGVTERERGFSPSSFGGVADWPPVRVCTSSSSCLSAETELPMINWKINKVGGMRMLQGVLW